MDRTAGRRRTRRKGRKSDDSLMGQWEIYEAIQSLGGRATFAQIRKYMQNKYSRCCDSSTHDALKKLICNGLVSGAPIAKANGRRLYRITGEFPERNIVIVVRGMPRS